MLSRVFGQSSILAGGRSIYETLRQQDDDEDSDNPEDLEARAGMRAARYDEDLEGPDNNYELRPPQDLTGTQYTHSEIRQPFGSAPRSRGLASSRLNYMSGVLPEPDTEADEVPASLLVERTSPFSHDANRDNIRGGLGAGFRQSAPSKPATHAHLADPPPVPRRGTQVRTEEDIRQLRLGLIDKKAKAMWKWANIENVDNFLHDV